MKYAYAVFAALFLVLAIVCLCTGRPVFPPLVFGWLSLLGARQYEIMDKIDKVKMDLPEGEEPPKVYEMPCDLCAYGPPSSCDGKPCTMCPATARMDLPVGEEARDDE